MREFHTCKNDTCINPKNTTLTVDDYCRSRPLKGGAPGYRYECRMCFSKRMSERRNTVSGIDRPIFGDMNLNDLKQCKMDVKTAQEFCLGRI